MAKINFGGVEEEVITSDEFPLTKAQEILKNEVVAILGYGVQGPAQAMNMKDNGINVIIGQAIEDKSYWNKAVADGWVPGKTLFSIEEAVKRGTIIQYLVSDAAVLYSKPLFVGAVSSLYGMAFTVIPHETACFRCLYPKAPTATMARKERNRGIIGTNPGIIGSIVAQNVLKYVVGSGDWLAGKLLLVDGEDNRFDLVPLERNPQCRICGDKPTITELFSMKKDTRQSSC